MINVSVNSQFAYKMGVTIEQLQEQPFVNRTLNDQIRIVLDGKPRPVLQMSAVTVGDDGEISAQNFDPAMYDQVQWLTASEAQQSFLCWPCILYAKHSSWKLDDIAFLSEAIPKHEKTPEHLVASLSFKMFVGKHVNTQKLSVDGSKVNEMIHQNRDVIRILIDAIINIVSKDQAPRKRRDSQSRIQPENCLRTLQFQRNYAGRRISQVDQAIMTVKACPVLLDDLVDAMTAVLRAAVKREAGKSTFASLIVSEHSPDPSKSQLSTVMRFIKNGDVCERFLGFTNIFESKSKNVISNFLLGVTKEFEIPERLVGYAFDGGVLNMHNLTDLLKMLQRHYPSAYFVPSYYHELYYVLQQSLATIPECAQFFKVMGVMEANFAKNSKCWKAFEALILRSNPLLKWPSDMPFTVIVNSCRKHFVEFLDTILQNCTKWSTDDVVNACGFQQFLKQFQTIFLLQVFASVIQQVSTLDKALKSKALENTFGSDMAGAVTKKLLAEKETGFDNIWKKAVLENECHGGEESKRLKTDFDETNCHRYHELYHKIMYRIMHEISLRFSHLDKLEFCGMLNIENGVYSVEDSGLDAFFNYYQIHMDPKQHGFDLERFKNELIVLRQNNAIFANKNVHDLLKYLTDVKTAFKDVNRLSEFILTMPFKPPSPDSDNSKFEKIKKFAYSAEGATVAGDISVLHIESDCLQDLMRNAFFYDNVISKLFEKNRIVELMLQKR